MGVVHRQPRLPGRLPLVLSLLFLYWNSTALSASPANQSESSRERAAITAWMHLIDDAASLHLPVEFLRSIPSEFVTLEFEDLHDFAAEYHPEDHRMVLNRALSFNAAGGTLRPLSALPPRDIGTLYHELFHAYLDYGRIQMNRNANDERMSRFLKFAENQRLCRYETVEITPIVQRKNTTETRHLTEQESWEALNETWAVFMGWSIWTHLELTRGRIPLHDTKGFLRWTKRLAQADRNAELIGYYEPEDPEERMIARKRYLAPSRRISSPELQFLLETLLEVPPRLSKRAAKAMGGQPLPCPEKS
jgi:hypothetical protein